MASPGNILKKNLTANEKVFANPHWRETEALRNRAKAPYCTPRITPLDKIPVLRVRGRFGLRATICSPCPAARRLPFLQSRVLLSRPTYLERFFVDWNHPKDNFISGCTRVYRISALREKGNEKVRDIRIVFTVQTVIFTSLQQEYL